MTVISELQDYINSLLTVEPMLEEKSMGDPDSDMKREEQIRKIRDIRANEAAHVRDLKRLYAEHQRFIIKETMMKHAGYMVEKHGDEIFVYRRVEVDE